MRILHIGKYFPPVPGGMERFLGDLVVAQRQIGHESAVLVHTDGGTCHDRDPPWVMRCRVLLKLAFAPIAPSFLFWFAIAMRRLSPDVLHLHLPNISAFWALLLPTTRRVPWVVHWHSDVEPSPFRTSLRLLYPYYRVFEQALLDRANAIVVTSHEYLESSEPLAKWRDKCHVVSLGLAPERLPDLPGDRGHELWNGFGCRLLAVGRLTYYKGFETLIRAVAGCAELELVIVGEGDERPALERVIAELNEPSNIRLIGAVDDAICHELMASSDIFCLPSRERTEAFGIVLLEAMRYGKPLLASNLPGSGVTWVVRDGVNGLLVPPDDVSAWRVALLALASDEQRRAQLGANGRARFWRSFNIGDIAKQLDMVYLRAQELQTDDDVLDQSSSKDRPLVVIPALNEAGTIGMVIAEIHETGLRDILVVDDGSTDETARIAAAAGAIVMRPVLGPQGAWGAIQTGIRYAVRRGYPGVVTVDADGQHEPEYLARLICAKTNADVVIGAYPDRGSWSRRVAWEWFRRITGFELDDLTSGFRFYNRRACEILARQEATLIDYQDIGVLLLLRHAGMEIAEIPVAMNIRSSGKSRIFSSWWTVAKYMVETSLLCLARWGIKSKTP